MNGIQIDNARHHECTNCWHRHLNVRKSVTKKRDAHSLLKRLVSCSAKLVNSHCQLTYDRGMSKLVEAAKEFWGPIVHHHESCLKTHINDLAVLSANESQPARFMRCTCDEVPSIDELNELLGV